MRVPLDVGVDVQLADALVDEPLRLAVQLQDNGVESGIARIDPIGGGAFACLGRKQTTEGQHDKPYAPHLL